MDDSGPQSGSNVKVAVRVRPMNRRGEFNVAEKIRKNKHYVPMNHGRLDR